MRKDKPRHNPDKPQNRYGNSCYYSEKRNDKIYCEGNFGDTKICKGNRHNCVKTKYHKIASETK